MIVILDNGCEYSLWAVVFISLPAERLQELKDLLEAQGDVGYGESDWSILAEAESLTWRSDDQTQDGGAFIDEVRRKISDREWTKAAEAEHKGAIDRAVASGVPAWKARADIINPLWYARCEARNRKA